LNSYRRIRKVFGIQKMKRIFILGTIFIQFACGIPSLTRNPLEFFSLLRIFGRSSSTLTEHSLGGAVSGLLSGTSVTLTNNQESVIVSADGNFTFPTKLKSGTTYSVTLTTTATNLTCTLSNAQGTVQSSDISNVSVTCGWGNNYYEVGVNVSGISGTITVQNNASNSLNISANGLHKFSERIATGSSFAVTISSQPVGTICSFDEPTLTIGSIATSNITLYITCVTGYLVGGNLHLSASSDLGTNLISRNAYLRTRVGSYPPTSSSGLAVPSAGPTAARFNSPAMIATDYNFIYVADSVNAVIRKIDKSNGTTTILAGGDTGGGTTCPGGSTVNCKDGVETAAQFNGIVGLATNGNNLYVLESTGRRIRKVNLTNAVVSTFAGTGFAASADNASGMLASFNNPSWITVFNGNLYVVDRGNCTIRVVNPVTTAVTTLAGGPTLCNFTNDPIGTNARFVSPLGIVGLGTYLYVTDIGPGGGHKIRRISLSGTNAVDTIAGDGVQASTDGFGTNAQFNDPHGITTDGTNLFISEWSGHKIRHVRLSDNKVTTLVGSVSGYEDNTSGNGLLNFPGYILSDGVNIYISDTGNHSIRYLEHSEILRYTFDGDSNDSIGTNHGLLTGSPTTTTDENGNASGAYEFDGSTQYIQSTSNISPVITDNLTISAWVYPAGVSGSQFLFYNGQGGANGYGVIFNGSNRTINISLGGVAASGNSTMMLPLNQWSHIVLTRKATNWQVFINGKSDSLVFSLAPIAPASTFKVADAGNGFYFKGKISDVRFLNGALDNDAIQKLAIQVPSGLISYFPLNGNSKDYGNYLNHLTVSGATTTTDRNGHANGAYNFNGGAFMQKLNPSGLPTGSSPRTNCVWFRTTNTVGQYLVGYGLMNPPAGLGNGLVITSTVTGNFGVTDDANVFHEEFINQWMHLCGIYDSTTAYVYENGVLRHSEPKTWSTATSPNLEVGRLINGTGNFFGDIDDVRIYNRALSVSEMKALAGHYPTQVSSWNQTLASSSLKFFLMPQATTYSGGLCSGGVNCVSAWNDRSGSGYNVSQGLGTSQPFYNATGINGSPAVRFVGTVVTPAYMTKVCEPALNSTSNSIFAVLREVDVTGNNGIFQNGAQTSGKLVYFPDAGGNRLSLMDRQIAADKLITTGAFNISNEEVIMALNFNGTSGNIYKSGSLVGSNSFAGIAYNCSGGDLHIGRKYNGGIFPFDGDYFEGFIGDFLYFDQVLSASDRQIVECYLSNKYNIPVGHTCP